MRNEIQASIADIDISIISSTSGPHRTYLPSALTCLSRKAKGVCISIATMLSKLWSKKGQLFEAYDVTVSLISCTNLKISGQEAGVEGDVKLYAYASFIANNESIPLTIDGIAGNTHVRSKPLMRTHAVDTTAMWGDHERSSTAVQFSYNVSKKEKTQSNVTILLGLAKGEERCPLAVTTVHIDPSEEDYIVTLPVNDIGASTHTKKRRLKLFSFKKKKLQQPALMDYFGLQSSAQGAKLNARVQVREKGESNAAMVEESRHDVDTRVETFEEESVEDKREDTTIVEHEEDDLESVETAHLKQGSNKPLSLMEKVFRGFSCGSVLTCQGEEEELNLDHKESRGESPTGIVDKTVESDLKKMVENVRNELEIGQTASASSSDEEPDFSTLAGGTTFQSRTVHFRIPASANEEDTTVDDEVTKQKRRHSDNSSYDDTFTAFDNTAYTEDLTKQMRSDDDSSYGDTFTAFDNTAYTEDVTKQIRYNAVSSYDDTFTAFDNTAYTEDVTKQMRSDDDSSYGDTFTAFDNTAYTEDVKAFTRADDSTFMGNIFM